MVWTKTMTRTSGLLALTLLLLVIPRAEAQDPNQVPAEVPPNVHQQPQADGDGIQFHDPSEFRAANEAGTQRTQHVGRGKHSHTLGGGKGASIDIQHEKEHMKMHMKEEYVNMDDLNEGQFTAMYFQTFDLDRSGQIDGLEMLKAMLKMNREHDEHNPDPAVPDIDTVVAGLDEQIKFYDANDDGFITYVEFKSSMDKSVGGH